MIWSLCKPFKDGCHLLFEMTDMGEAFYILGVKIHSDRSHKLVTLLQEHYIKNIIE